MNNCNCAGLLPLIFGFIVGKNAQNCCGCNCDQNVMPINNMNSFGGFGNECWIIILLLLVCGCGGNNNSCGCNF